jgi:PAS domain S-box-containing protein
MSTATGWHPGRDLRGWLLAAALVWLGVVVLGVVAVRFAPDGSGLAAWWPATGLAVAFLLYSPTRRRPAFLVALVVAAALATTLGGRHLIMAAALGVVDGVGAFLVAALVARGRPGRVRLKTLEQLWLLVVAAFLGGILVGLGIGLVFSLTLGTPFIEVARAAAASQVASVLLIAPLGLDVAGPPTGASRVEQGLQVALTTVALLAVFAPGQDLPLDFLPIPLLIWGAIRTSMRTTTVELLVVGVIATLMTSLGHGPIAADQVKDGLSPEATTALMQAYLVCIALVVLPLAVSGLQRREALLAARAGEEQFRRSFTDSLIGMLLLRRTTDGLVVAEVNDVAARQFGAAPDELLGRVWRNGLAAADEERLREACERILAREQDSWAAEVRLGHEDQGWARLAVTALDRPGGERMLSVQLVDLTTEREALADLEGERDFTQAVLDSANTLIIVIDHEGRVVRFNPAAEKLSGYVVDDVTGRPVWDVVGPALAARLRAHLAGHHSQAHSVQVEEDWTTRTNERRTVVWACAFLDPGREDSHLVMTGIDVTEERLAQGLVEQVLAATTGTSIIGTDLEGTITFFNPGAERLLGYTADELVGRASPSVFHDPGELQSRARDLGLPSEFGVLVAGVEPGAEPEKRDWHYVRKDGEKIVMSLTVSPMTSASGRVVGYLGVAEDVTERRRVEDLLRVALAKERQVVERLNEVDQAKTEFVSSVSHELRTPITSVLGYTQMLQRGSGGGLTERQAKLLARVESNGLRLQALIEDLLTLSRIEAGTFEMHVSLVDLRQVVRHGLEATEVLRAERDLGFGVHLVDVPVMVSGDHDQLERAVINLLSNAVKFTPDGGRVDVTLETRGSQVELSVEDTGIGIPLREQGRLFERFFRSSTAQQRAIPGTGLGLSIVRGIAAGHGGTVSVTSQEGRGTRVELRLPLEAPAATVIGQRGPAGPRPVG